jgi:two-component system, NarL family, nitrate/nitrite response regulator NarL
MLILVIDDHAALRLGVVGLIKRLQPDATVIEAGSGQEALKLIAQHKELDFVLLDLELPDHSGFEMLAMIRAKAVRAAIVIFSGYDQQQMVRQALRLGAMSFISKKYPMEKFENILSQVLQGRPHVPQAETDVAPTSLGAKDTHFFPAQTSSLINPNSTSGRFELTEREKQVLRFLVQGWGNKDIGEALEMKDGTTKTHVNSIYRKLGVTSRTELIIAVERLGLVL